MVDHVIDYPSICRQYGSPAYVYQLHDLRQSFYALKAALPQPSSLYFSIKSNPHPQLLEELFHLGCQAEVSSSGELVAAISSGISGERCFYTSPSKTSDEIDFALTQGVRSFSFDSLHEAENIAKASKQRGTTAELLLRINPDHRLIGPKLTMTGIPSQFGMDPQYIGETLACLSKSSAVNVSGFHIYTGTNIQSPSQLLRIFETTLETIAELSVKHAFNPLKIILGGGFGHQFAKTGELINFDIINEPLKKLLNQLFPKWTEGSPSVAFEAGRYLVASCGRLLSTVLDIKASKGKKYIILDTGIHHLGGMTGLNRTAPPHFEFLPLQNKLEQNVDTSLLPTDIVGPLCTPLDHLSRNVRMDHIKIGDLVQVPNVGAYGLTASLVGFLSKPLPLEIVLDNNEIISVSRLHISRTPVKIEV